MATAHTAVRPEGNTAGRLPDGTAARFNATADDCECCDQLPPGGESGCECAGTACFDVTISGVTNNGCETCSVFNDTFSVAAGGTRPVFAVLPAGAQVCDSSDLLFVDVACGELIVYWVIYKLDGDFFIVFSADYNGTGGYTEWGAQITYVNCVPTLSNALTKIDSDATGQCNFDNATITATVVECAP